MRFLLLTACAALAAACNDDAVVAVAPQAPLAAAVVQDSNTELQRASRTMYKEAYERAHRAIRAENARAHLNHMEEQIDHEREVMR